MKCTRHRCHVAPHGADRLLQSHMRIGDHQAHPLEAAFHETAQKGRPEGAILRRADIDPQDLTLALDGDADRDDRRLAGDVPIDADLVIRRIDPHVGILADERPGAEGLDERIELRADARDPDFDTPSSPSAFISSSTLRVETPCTYASCTTASSACSARRRGCSNEGK
jgi:hypothetical protein